jgi:hypothetical protein
VNLSLSEDSLNVDLDNSVDVAVVGSFSVISWVELMSSAIVDEVVIILVLVSNEGECLEVIF